MMKNILTFTFLTLLLLSNIQFNLATNCDFLLPPIDHRTTDDILFLLLLDNVLFLEDVLLVSTSRTRAMTVAPLPFSISSRAILVEVDSSLMVVVVGVVSISWGELVEPLRGEDDTARMVAISFSFVPFLPYVMLCYVMLYSNSPPPVLWMDLWCAYYDALASPILLHYCLSVSRGSRHCKEKAC